MTTGMELFGVTLIPYAFGIPCFGFNDVLSNRRG